MPQRDFNTQAGQNVDTRLRQLWQAGKRTSVEEFLQQHPEVASNEQHVLDLIYAEFLLREAAGESPHPQEYRQRFPSHGQEIDRLFDVHFAAGLSQSESRDELDSSLAATTHRYSAPDSKRADATDAVLANSVAATPIIGAHVGRYRIIEKLGEGAFGAVYKAFDPELSRDVAIKLPHPRRDVDAEAYLSEARSVALLDHPGIVPVFDVGRAPDGQCYVVSKYIAGGSLDRTMKERRPPDQSARLVAEIGEALHHAHGRGLVHRDVKPANILIDEQGRPLLADFGLALKEEDFGQGFQLSGTPSYMSPEQARGEGNVVDARSDIYSLGVVLFELLTGRRPYRSRSQIELLKEIITVEARPPRQLEDTIPADLDRICLKALAKRPIDRYSTAIDLCNDLRHWLASARGDASLTDPAAAAKPSASWRFVLAGSILTVAIGLGCWLLGKSWTGRSAETVSSDRRDSTTEPLETVDKSAAPAAVWPVDMQVRFQRADEKGQTHILSADDGPLHDNDRVQLHIRVDRPRYCYVYWCDEHRNLRRLWPTDLAKQEKISDLKIPQGRNRWLPLQGGRGIEIVVAGAADHPLQPNELDGFEKRAVFLEGDRRVPRLAWLPSEGVTDQDRGVGAVVESSETLLSEDFEEDLRTKFNFYRAAVFPHE